MTATPATGGFFQRPELCGFTRRRGEASFVLAGEGRGVVVPHAVAGARGVERLAKDEAVCRSTGCTLPMAGKRPFARESTSDETPLPRQRGRGANGKEQRVDTHERAEDRVRTASRPSELKITDLRTATVGWDRWHFTLVRLDTNQGLSGYGEVRDFASKTYALMLKRLLLGENPCNLDKLFRTIKQFGHHGRQAGGVCGVEMALMDLAGKAYGVPAYALVGGKFRDRIRMYCDTPNEPTGAEMGCELLRKIEQGFTMLKMDVGVQPLIGVEGALSWPQGMLPGDAADRVEDLFNITQLMHPFTHVRLTPKGIDLICEYVAEVRAVVGDKAPIAADHFGHIGIDDCLRLGQALEPYNLAWLEDLVPWQFTDKWVQLERALNTPVCTGEDIYLLDGFKPLLDARAVNIVHPDLATSGGIMETKKIGDYAQECGISMGAAHGRYARQHHGQRPLRRGDAELHRPGAPLQQGVLLGRLHRRRAEADHSERLHPGARGAGARLRVEPGRGGGTPRSLGPRLLRADFRMGRRAKPRSSLVLTG